MNTPKTNPLRKNQAVFLCCGGFSREQESIDFVLSCHFLSSESEEGYGVATISRINKMIGLFCRLLALLKGSFAKETCNFIDPTKQSHPTIVISVFGFVSRVQRGKWAGCQYIFNFKILQVTFQMLSFESI